MRTRVGLQLALLAVCTALPGSSDAGSVWWTKRLNLSDLAHIEERLKAPFEEQAPVTKGKLDATIATCADYGKYRGLGYRPTSDRVLRLLQFEIVDCRALECLRHAMPARISYLADFRLGADAPRELPARFAVAISPDDMQKEARAAKRGLSWLAYQPASRAQPKGDLLKTSGAGMRSTLEIYARADFNGDGIEDLLIRQDYSAEQGTYAGSRLFMLTRRSRGHILEVLEQYD